MLICYRRRRLKIVSVVRLFFADEGGIRITCERQIIPLFIARRWSDTHRHVYRLGSPTRGYCSCVTRVRVSKRKAGRRSPSS
jgi:hypothetical protein